jgi:trans-aconitate methyltransferase
VGKDAWLDWYKERKVEPAVVDFARLLKNARATRVLDFGCGTGRNTIYLAARRPV